MNYHWWASVASETLTELNYSIKQALLKRRSVRKFRRKRLLFKKQKVDSTGYYGIEDPFPDLKTSLFYGGIRNAVVLMLRKLLLLEGS